MIGEKGTWGGHRDNQTGRPPLEGETQKRREIVVTETRWKKIRRIGKGNYSQGVRVLLDFWEENNKKRP